MCFRFIMPKCGRTTQHLQTAVRQETTQSKIGMIAFNEGVRKMSVSEETFLATVVRFERFSIENSAKITTKASVQDLNISVKKSSKKHVRQSTLFAPILLG